MIQYFEKQNGSKILFYILENLAGTAIKVCKIHLDNFHKFPKSMFVNFSSELPRFKSIENCDIRNF